MKVKILSDIHLEHFVACQTLPVGIGDVLVLAGDILCAKNLTKNGYLKEVYLQFLNECSKNYDKVLYVKGNHEFYGYNYEGTKKKIIEYLPSNVHLLDNDTITIGNWNFIGFTFWTDFRCENALEMMEAECNMNDYNSIRIGSNYRKLRADVFVISHHAPSYQSVPQEFKKHANGAYCSNLDDLILNHPQIKYWCHGHTHTPFDYNIGNCRVICNPHGYPGQSTRYNPDLYIEI
jgi:Icc-related predicted phosphoesterase